MADPIASKLNTLLADTVVFYYKLHNAHWFVTGPEFLTLHAHFEDLYTAWHTHLDDIAERVLALDEEPVPTLAAAVERATLKERTDHPDAHALVRETIDDLMALHGSIVELIKHAEPAGDRTTCNILDAINDAIEKDVWMLKAQLPK